MPLPPAAPRVPSDASDEHQPSGEGVAEAATPPKIQMRRLTPEEFAQILRRQVSGAHRAIDAFDRAKIVSQASLTAEVSL